MKILERQRQIFRKGSVVIHDAEDGAAHTMGFEAATAEGANRPVVICGTGNVDFSADAFAEPFRFFCRGNAIDVGDFADKFVAGNSTKGVIAAKNFHVSVADTSKEYADECPARTEFWDRCVSRD